MGRIQPLDSVRLARSTSQQSPQKNAPYFELVLDLGEGRGRRPPLLVELLLVRPLRPPATFSNSAWVSSFDVRLSLLIVVFWLTVVCCCFVLVLRSCVHRRSDHFVLGNGVAAGVPSRGFQLMRRSGRALAAERGVLSAGSSEATARLVNLTANAVALFSSLRAWPTRFSRNLRSQRAKRGPGGARREVGAKSPTDCRSGMFSAKGLHVRPLVVAVLPL